MALSVGDILQVVVSGTIHSQRWNNILNFRVNDNTKLESDLASAVLSCFAETLIAALAEDWSVDSVKAKKIYPTVGGEHEAAESVVSGSISDTALPSYVAAVVRMTSDHGGRSGHGRTYLAGLPDTGQSFSELNPDEAGLLADFLTCLATKFISGDSGFDLGVLSRKNRLATPGTPTNWFFPATQLHLLNQLGTMRSRKIGHGI